MLNGDRLNRKLDLFIFCSLVLGLGNVLFAVTVPDADISERFEKRFFKDSESNVLPYRLLKPEELDKERKYPLVVLLHGIGERGDDNEAQLKWGAKEFAKDENMEKYPCFVAVPQCPISDFWAAALRDLSKDFKMSEKPTQALQMTLELIEVLQEEFSQIDSDRLYITGLSMGGFGTWDAIQRKPDLFAAAVPICGGGDVTKATRLTEIPIWVFHGAEDLLVDPKWSREMVEAIQNAGGNPKYTEYPGVGHHSWIPAYSDPALFEWLFSQKKKTSTRVQYPFVIDNTYTARTGAHNIITLHRGLYGLENRLLQTRWFDEKNFVKKAAGLTYRLAKTILIDNVVDHLSFLAQHEVFGHGARYREFGFVNNEFTLNLPPPYGNGRGWARTGRLEEERFLSAHEHIAMKSGGSESNIILSGIMQANWLQRGSIHYRESILYLMSANDLSLYILRTKYGLRGEAGNDVLNYLKALNVHEGYLFEEDYELALDDLAAKAWINLLNPFQYFSLYAYFKTYLWSGDESLHFPMIELWGVEYLPSFRLGLTPFGPEFYLENFVVKSDRIFNLYFRYGNPTFHKFWGMGAHVINLVKGHRFTVNTRLDIWDQPPLELGGDTIRESDGGLGGRIQGTFYYRLFKDKSLIHLTAQIGYKTAGFLEGEQLADGIVLRVGISFFGL